MISSSNPLLKYLPQIIKTISQQIKTNITQQKKQLRIVLQICKQNLNNSFQLTQLLKKQYNKEVLFFTLYDSMKNPCCIDILGARHVNYDLLFHFGYACFSQKYNPKHYYLLQIQEDQEKINLLYNNLIEKFKYLQEKSIQIVIVEQKYYSSLKKRLLFQSQEKYKQIVDKFCSFSFDRNKQSLNQYEYIAFGYYKHKNQLSKNALIICQNQLQSNLIQNFMLTKTTIGIQNLYTMSLDKNISQVSINITKKIMQRLSLASQLQKYDRFGILINNPSTQFCKLAISYCQQILIKNQKKVFTFMMNNLNQVKLGNFPQIQVYVIISCYNHSLYTTKDFFKIVVTPFDLQLAFQNKSITEYCLDLKNWHNKYFQHQNLNQNQNLNQKYFTDSNINLKLQKNQFDINNLKQQKNQKCSKQNCKCKSNCSYQNNSCQNKNYQIIKVQNKILLASQLQTLDFYKSRQYKGLEFKQKKDIKKMTKGKIGLAQHYQPLFQ